MAAPILPMPAIPTRMFVSCHETNRKDFEGIAKDSLQQRSLTSPLFGCPVDLVKTEQSHGKGFTNHAPSIIIYILVFIE
jgi:hypothetical protein